MTQVHLWTDGSGTTQGNPGGWAFVLIAAGHKRIVSGYARDATNNQMEMTAVLEGLRLLKRPCEVVIHTDSQYVMYAFTEHWITGWKKKNWRKVKNVELWKMLIAEVEAHQVVEFEWCAGHKGHEYNEVCDRLAGKARKNGYGTDTGRIPLVEAQVA